VGISTSGNSRNVCLALDAGRQLGAFTVAFTDRGAVQMAGVVGWILSIASQIQRGSRRRTSCAVTSSATGCEIYVCTEQARTTGPHDDSESAPR